MFSTCMWLHILSRVPLRLLSEMPLHGFDLRKFQVDFSNDSKIVNQT